MEIQLKPIKEQVVVIVGATSGIGLATARLAAQRGARVVLAARSKPDLKRAVRRIREQGGQATYAVADAGRPAEVEAVADAAIREFGAIDSWVNCASSSIYGKLAEIPLSDAHQLFETNYWGVVHGSLVAAAHLRERGGAIINIGSVLSDVAVPLQGYYVASKHAVKGFTDALRMELETEEAPISVTLIKPSSVDTPFTRHARNYMETEPEFPAPVYHPRVVARTILRVAQSPRREVIVGGGGRMMTAMNRLAPRLADRYMESVVSRQQQSDEPRPKRRRDSLYRPQKGNDGEQGDTQRHVLRTSMYTGARLHPVQTALALGLIGAAAVVALRRDVPREPGDYGDLRVPLR